MDLGNKNTWKCLFLPGAPLLLLAAILLQGKIFPLSVPAVHFYYFAVFAAGILLAWRFHSGRVLFALITILLAHRAVEFFSAGHIALGGPGRIALEAVAFLLPLNLLALSLRRERGVGLNLLAPHLAVLFLESVFVAVICRPEETTSPAFLRLTLFGEVPLHGTHLPQVSWLIFGVTVAALVTRIMMYRKPVDGGLLWALISAFVGLAAGGVGPEDRSYVATGALILITSIIENSYALAYHDELTTLPSRRAFNDALLRLEPPYTLAVVDIDHFKNFNDTYGHETGDQVLRMVATQLGRVTGGGQAFRIGGEEFCILFRGKTATVTREHLELLRQSVETSDFRVRGAQQAAPTSPERRRPPRRKSPRQSLPSFSRQNQDVHVTISIGVAEATLLTREAEAIVRAADKALYRAKQSGRNRVELAGAARSRRPRPGRQIA